MSKSLDKLQESIKKKFGNYPKFARSIGMDQYELKKFFAAARKNMSPMREREVERLTQLCKETSPEGSSEVDLTEELINKFRVAIAENGGVSKFCEENPEFTESTVKGVIYGNRKRRTEIVNKLLTKLNIE